MTLLNTADHVRVGAASASRVYAGATRVWPPAPPFTPAALPGLVVWLDASTLALADGAAVAQLSDLSGQNHHAVQASTISQPTCRTGLLAKGRVVHFDGVDDGLAVPPFAFPAQHTAIVLARANDAVPSQDGYLNAGTNPTRVFQLRQQDAATVQSAGFDAAGTGYVNVQPCPTQAWHRLAYTRSPTSVEVFIDNASTGATASAGTLPAPTVNLYVGSGNFQARPGAVDIAEVIVYDHALAPADRAQVDAYLAAKWL